MHHSSFSLRSIPDIIQANLCIGCGACLTTLPPQNGQMHQTNEGWIPKLTDPSQSWPSYAWEDCPAKGLDLGEIYLKHFHRYPEDWRLGVVDQMWIGHATNPNVRLQGASGGLTTALLVHLLETHQVDAAVVAHQGKPTPEAANWEIVTNPKMLVELAGSVYIPVPMLAALPHLDTRKRYAMTCLPEQAAALRNLQLRGDPKARSITHLIGPYTGTALVPTAIRALLRSHGVDQQDQILSLRWRAGEWPGYMEVRMASGKIIRSPKVYYNFLIPFYIWPPSLRGIDFANEFTDLSVGDAWSPNFERQGKGFSVVISRNPQMTALLKEMEAAGKIHLEPIAPPEAAEMHGHMIDFKKRGSFIRNQLCHKLGIPAPDWGLAPKPLGIFRCLIELVVSALFCLGSTTLARAIMEHVPPAILGPIFNQLRLMWKAFSKPAKRHGLRNLTMTPYTPLWKTSATN